MFAGKKRCRNWTEPQTRRWHGLVFCRLEFVYQSLDFSFGTWRLSSRRRSSSEDSLPSNIHQLYSFLLKHYMIILTSQWPANSIQSMEKTKALFLSHPFYSCTVKQMERGKENKQSFLYKRDKKHRIVVIIKHNVNLMFGFVWCIYEVNKPQWWSEGRVSLIFSSLLRMSRNDGLWFMSASQHFTINLSKRNWLDLYR